MARGDEKSETFLIIELMKHYFLDFTVTSEQEFLNLPYDIQKRIKTKMEFYINSENPLHFAKKLHGSDDAYRFRIGDYRVIVTPKEKKFIVILLILKIGHRREVYE